MVFDIVRDSTFGNIVNYLSNGRIFSYRDQRSDYNIPKRYVNAKNIQSDASSVDVSSATTRVPTPMPPTEDSENKCVTPTTTTKDSLDLEKGQNATVTTPTVPSDPYLVDWDGDDDPDNPK
jgi:MFS transporter, DHA1 family, multidrug resistance protein